LYPPRASLNGCASAPAGKACLSLHRKRGDPASFASSFAIAAFTIERRSTVRNRARSVMSQPMHTAQSARSLQSYQPTRYGAVLGALVLLTSALAAAPLAAQGTAAIDIREDFKPGKQYHVNCHVDIKGQLVVPPEKGQTQSTRIDVVGKSRIKYDER